MNEILFRAHGRKACVAFCGDLTSGSVGLPVKFEFDSAWDGLQKTAIFKGSGTTIDVVLTGDTTAVPAEVMEDSGLSLKVGVWGAAPDGNVVIPTVWVEVGKIKPGAEPSGIDPHQPAPSWAAQVQQIATEALSNSEEAVATANATETRMTALEQEIAGDVEQAREYAQQAQAAAESAGADAQTASAAAQTAGSAASTASAAAATATEKAADTARDATAAQEAASEAETAKEAAETAAASIAASAAQIEQNRQDIADLDTEVSQQKSAIDNVRINLFDGTPLIDYAVQNLDYSGTPGAPDSSCLAVYRRGSRIVLNGGDISNATRPTAFVKLTGNTAGRTNNSANVRRWTDGITLKAGRRYQVTVIYVSGTATGGVDTPLSTVSVYNLGESSTIGYQWRDNENGKFYRVFTATGELNLALFVPCYEITYEDYTIDVILEELDAVDGVQLPMMVTNTALAINDFRIVDGELFRVTAPIASGDELIPGTNCVKTTIAEVLTQILNT